MRAFRDHRRVFFALSALLLGLAAPLPAAQAQEWPNRPIRILVGFPPGQATDVIARLLAERLTENPGWSMLIDNRPGQGGSLAAAQAAQSAPPTPIFTPMSAMIRGGISRRSAWWRIFPLWSSSIPMSRRAMWRS